MSATAGSITRLIPHLLVRDEVAIGELWRRCVGRMEGVARPTMSGVAAGAGDEQDVAQTRVLRLLRGRRERPDAASGKPQRTVAAALDDCASQGHRPRPARIASPSWRRGTGCIGRARLCCRLSAVAGGSPRAAGSGGEFVCRARRVGRSQVEVDRDPAVGGRHAARDRLPSWLHGATVQRKLHILERLWCERNE